MNAGTIPEVWPAAWVIRSDRERCHETGDVLFWSNADGWVDLDRADRFTYPERCALDLPLGGEWIVECTIWRVRR